MTIPYDVPRCAEIGCPLASQCARKTAGRPGYQVYSEFPGGLCCSGFIPREDKR